MSVLVADGWVGSVGAGVVDTQPLICRCPTCNGRGHRSPAPSMCTHHCVKSAGGPTDYLQDFISFHFKL